MNRVLIIRKGDKVLFSNKFKTIKEHDKTGFVYIDGTQGVSILPFRYDKSGKMELLVREEPNPLHRTILTIVAGGRDDHEEGATWWQETAQRELGEETGYWVSDKKAFCDLGDVVTGKDYKDKDKFVTVDLTGIEQGKMKPDKGSLIEKNAKNFWVSVDLLKRMTKEQGNNVDSYFLAMVGKFLSQMSLDKSIEKAHGPSKLKGREKPGHKYIRREPLPGGGYKYIYEEPKGRKKKGEEESPEKRLVAQLAELFGKKQASPEEKAPKKIDVLKEYSTIPDLGDFSKNVSTEQWMGIINSEVQNNVRTHITNANQMGSRAYAHLPLAILNSSLVAPPLPYPEDIKIEGKGLKDQAKNQIKNGIIALSYTKASIDQNTSLMNSSVVENMFSSISDKLDAADEKGNLSAYIELQAFRKIDLAIADSIISQSETMGEVKWLKGYDKKLDYLNDEVFNSVDNLVRARNRFMLSTFRFFIEKLDKKLKNLYDAHSIQSSLLLIENLASFANDSMRRTFISSDENAGVFSNQMNMKQKGVYEGAMRFLATASAVVINKMRVIQEEEGMASKFLATQIVKNPAFTFMTFEGSNSTYANNALEHSLAYIDMHGLDRFKQDVFYMAGLAKTVENDHLKNNRFNAAFGILEKAFRGDDIFNDEDVQQDYVDIFRDRHVGEMRDYGAAYGFHLPAFNATLNAIVLSNERTPMESKIPAFIRIWSNFSHGSLTTSAIEEFVDAKGIDRGSYSNYHLAMNNTFQIKRESTKSSLKSMMEKMYDITQSQLEEDYPDGKVKLYRGNGNTELKSAVTSWTREIGIAGNFGEEIHEAEVPVSAILLYKNPENSDYWKFPEEDEHIVSQGLLSADNQLKFKKVE